MKQRIQTGWNARRLLYLITGIAVIAQSVYQKEWLGILIGGYFAAMGLFSLGCAGGGCFGNSCNIEPQITKKEE